jgi:23S rRNA pseudouridine1911/1915/1917 synthase
LLLVNKPAGLVVHPGAGNREHTLVNALLYRFPQLADLTTCRFGLVHRLDKFTEGLMLVAKNSLAHQALSKQFEARTVVKKYYAIANANVSKDEFVLDAPIGRDPNNRQKYKVITEGRSKSRSALTLVKVLHRKPGKTLLEVQIKTGRTHQIRVHLFQAGFPVLGDPVYAQKKLQGNGQLLQAFYLGFTHPTTNQPMQFELPLAPRLARVITVPIAATVLP